MGNLRKTLKRQRTAPFYIFEGTWWSPREVPLVLPFLQALQTVDGRLSLSHRTFRSADDLKYWIKRIPKNDRAFVYIACHASNGALYPVDSRSHIAWDELLAALKTAKPGAIEFLHFSVCNIVAVGNRRNSLKALADASRAHWVSGYIKDVDWLPSMLLDIAVVSELFLPFYHETSSRRPQLRARARRFLSTYEQLSRNLGFSGLARKLAGIDALFPERFRR
jgi:hypothetical protein